MTGNTNTITSNGSASTTDEGLHARRNGFQRDPGREPRDTLSRKHREMLLVESSISPVVVRRPYGTIDDEEARRLGFPTIPEQAGTKFLHIALHSVAGGPSTRCLVRPDVPRTLRDSNGKDRILKYESQPRKPPILDIHPKALPLLQDIKTPLFLTEGNRKGDAGVSRGLCVISISGVWAWLHDKVALPDWRLVPLKKRVVYLAFDSDVVTKRSVARALRELGGFLELRGAAVKVIDWAGGFNG